MKVLLLFYYCFAVTHVIERFFFSLFLSKINASFGIGSFIYRHKQCVEWVFQCWILLILYLMFHLITWCIFATGYGDCPSPQSSQMASCTPKCLQNSECSTTGGLCCPNLCNTKSCTRPKSGSQGSSNGAFKGSARKCKQFDFTTHAR